MHGGGATERESGQKNNYEHRQDHPIGFEWKSKGGGLSLDVDQEAAIDTHATFRVGGGGGEMPGGRGFQYTGRHASYAR